MNHPGKPININAIARKIDVDNRIPLRYYYRIADTLLKQADIYREEKNIVDLYVILLRFSSLVSETIPRHRDYQLLHSRERTQYKKKLLAVIDELESLKPEFQHRVNELNKAYTGGIEYQLDGGERNAFVSEKSSSGMFSAYNNSASGLAANQLQLSNRMPHSSWKQNNVHNHAVASNSMDIDRKFQKLSLSLPLPKQETLSRHSFLGPNGLRGHWLGPGTEIKVQYPSCTDFTQLEDQSLTESTENEVMAVKDEKFRRDTSVMEEVLSLDDGRWSRRADDSCPLNIEVKDGLLSEGNIRQPAPPPVLAEVVSKLHSISPSRVADPRPGQAKSSEDGIPSANSYQHLHIPIRMMEDFLRLAQRNTAKNLETCGVLAGSLKNRVFHITTLIIPKQESTSDSCQTVNEEEIFEVQDKLSLFPLGWIHTHPSQTCFMSSVDLHTHYSYQIMLPEAIAIVMAPTDTSSPHGIFHLSDPGGLSVIRNCQQRGFHPHEEPSDGDPLYEHCSHVYMNPNLRFDVVDLR
ncbi:hypothetical protein Nepgr_020718 [Nepenthes gracilis]|uniref:MPN domain-containing protein n=1 Tax=Nepenthes gracilis TaxID=150966 RepID=A0AAD3SXH0_NEPGR|nr:hypothetical protein Nepgr_020718 [Nepenthes gracilis]